MTADTPKPTPYRPPKPSTATLEAKLADLESRLDLLTELTRKLEDRLATAEWFMIHTARTVQTYHPGLLLWRCDSCSTLVLTHREETCPRCQHGKAPKNWRRS